MNTSDKHAGISAGQRTNSDRPTRRPCACEGSITESGATHSPNECHFIGATNTRDLWRKSR